MENLGNVGKTIERKVCMKHSKVCGGMLQQEKI